MDVFFVGVPRSAFSVPRSAFGLLHYLYGMSFEIQNAIDLIPQRAPFVFVDKLIYIDENTSHGSFEIPSENIFVKSGYYSASGMVESLAQTAAAGTGYLCKINNKKIPVGYIGAVQKLEVLDWPPANAEIILEINLITNVLQVSLVSGIVKYRERVMASCEMKIFVTH
jgi:3-hydroxymyristoyl/3-hydroxydecanoyl-(acyl carrier protein) dehydratase